MEAYLHEHIPLSAAMAARVLEVGPEAVVMEAPLEPNLNHRATAFGGSLSALAILAGWALVHFRLRDEGLEVRTVIHGSDVVYDEPVHGDFRARCAAPPREAWRRFVRTVRRRGKGRIRVEVALTADGTPVGRCTASYVALERSVADASTPGDPPPH